MFKNYLKIAWRNLNKSRSFTLINLSGLTIGITVCMMIFLFIMHEFSVDGFQKNSDNIYRVMRSYDPAKPATSYLSGPYAPAMLNDFPQEIKRAVRVMNTNALLSFDDKAFREKYVFVTDPDFFELFSFRLLRGKAENVISDPNNIALSETIAKKYFGSVDAAMGKVLRVDKEFDMKVTGVFKDVPSNSHLEFDMVYSNLLYRNQEWYQRWRNNNGFVYLQLNEGATEARLEKKFPAFMQKYMGKDMAQMNAKFELSLTPMKDIYFSEASEFDGVRHGEMKVIFIFLSIAALILLIACINFMNLSTIRAMERSKEVGLRKVMGALRSNLIRQFIGESVMLTVISCLLALLLLQVAMPLYSNLLGYDLRVNWRSPMIYLFLGGVVIVAGFMAGSYPAFFLSSFSPIAAIKGKLRVGKGGAMFRQGLVIVQFSISVFLIITTIVIVNQMSHVKNMDLGYNQSQTIIVPIDNGDIYNNRRSFRDELLADSRFKSVSFMSGEPGGFYDMHAFDVEGQSASWRSRTLFADEEVVNNLQLKMIAGRNFSRDMKTDSAEAMIINRTAANGLGLTPEQAIGKRVHNTMREDMSRRIVGVVEDFNFLSLKQKMDPLVIMPGDDHRVALVRFATNDAKGAVEKVKAVYSKMAPVYPLEYSFLDAKFDQLYKNDIRQETVITVFAGLAIFVACLGLFGLASYTTARRIKEIGVRKVLGSSVKGIVVLLSKDLLKPVFIASLLAVPLAWYAMNSWLQNFAYKVPLSWWIFVLAGVITFAVALITIGFKAIGAALANPVKSLRSE
ncbi:MAG: ABC transporter permease [Flavitalea sp.]